MCLIKAQEKYYVGLLTCAEMRAIKDKRSNFSDYVFSVLLEMACIPEGMVR